MNKLCCKVNPEFICRACGMTVCSSCYALGAGPRDENKEYVRKVMWHEEGAQCPDGANKWLNEGDNDEREVIFGKV